MKKTICPLCELDTLNATNTMGICAYCLVSTKYKKKRELFLRKRLEEQIRKI